MIDNWNDFELRLKDILKYTKYTCEIDKCLCLVLIKEDDEIKAYASFTSRSIIKSPEFNIGFINWNKLQSLVKNTDWEALWKDDE